MAGMHLSRGVLTTEENAEGSVVAVAKAAGIEAQAQVVVRRADLSDLIARRTREGVVRSDDEASLETATGVRAGNVESDDWGLLLPVLVAASLALVVLLGGVLLVVLMRRGRSQLAAESDLNVAPELAEPSAAVIPAGSTARVCPVCNEAFNEAGLDFCPKDGARLLEPGEVRSEGHPLICPTCRRGFPAGARYCPTDSVELLTYAAFLEGDGGGATAGTKRVCPKCGERYGGGIAFCSTDGTKLVPSP